MRFNRREALALGASGLLVPRKVLAQPGFERKFLFVFCPGGWDQCYLFAPLFDSSSVDMEPNAERAEVNGITFVDSNEKENVRAFFEDYGQKTCMINGFESRSVAHDVCLRLVCTGSSLPAGDDWPSIIAAHSALDPIMPLVSLSGPLYSHNYGSTIVRVGEAGQLAQLLDGSAFGQSDHPVPAPPASAEALQDGWLQELTAQRAQQAARGRAQEIVTMAADSEERLKRLQDMGGELDLGSGRNLGESLNLAADILEFGSSRCVMVGYDGAQNLGWDTHAGSFLQAIHLNELFNELGMLMRQLNWRSGSEGRKLSDEVTVVVMSEMGRFPQENSRGGKEHWTYTSCLLVGSGVRGGRTIGAYDDLCFGRKIDLSSGELAENGEDLVPGHVGATLLALADIDPAAHLDEEPILAAVDL